MSPNNLIPIGWDEDAVRLLSMIAPQDTAAASVWWETYAPLAYQAILDAGLLSDRDNLPRNDEEFEEWLQEQVDEGRDRKRRWWALGIFIFFASWRFVTMINRTITPQMVRGILDQTLFSARQDAKALCQSLLTGSISLADWQLRMVDIIRSVHIAAAALARGGFGRMSPDDWLAISNQINEQIAYLNNFANQISSGEQAFNGTICRRMQLYLEAGRGTYHEVERSIMEERGYDEFRNVRTALESCEECIEMENLGWVPIDSPRMVPIGNRLCNKNCKCYYEYRIFENT